MRHPRIKSAWGNVVYLNDPVIHSRRSTPAFSRCTQDYSPQASKLRLATTGGTIVEASKTREEHTLKLRYGPATHLERLAPSSQKTTGSLHQTKAPAKSMNFYGTGGNENTGSSAPFPTAHYDT